jgi:predicted acylesterase/phospholipase RssA
VDEYASEMIQALEFVARTKQMSLDDKRIFFDNISRLYGQSAICLSGGATLGYYHLGVIKALLEHHLLPKVFTGASAGSLMV